MQQGTWAAQLYLSSTTVHKHSFTTNKKMFYSKQTLMDAGFEYYWNSSGKAHYVCVNGRRIPSDGWQNYEC